MWFLPRALVAGSFFTAPLLANLPTTVEIPLYHVIDDNADHRLGVYAKLGGSPIPRLYELDTGSTGLYAAYNERWWPHGRIVKKNAGTQTYGSGVTFKFDVVQTSVDFGGGALNRYVEVARITRATGEVTPAEWNTLTREGKPALHGVFFGNMGSGLEEKNSLFAVLAQMPGNLGTGFVVETGGFVLRQPSLVPLRQGRITVGLTDAIRKRFEIQIPMRELQSGGRTVYLPTNFPAREEYPIAIDAKFSLPGQPDYKFKNVGALLDSGDPQTTVYETADETLPAAFLKGDRVRSGVEFSLEAAGTPDWKWGFIAGTAASVNRIDTASKAGKTRAEINLGLAPFSQYAVMYDLQRGILGLHRISPEPRVKIDGRKNRHTSRATVLLRGSATSPAGIRSVSYRLNGRSRLLAAMGSARWQAKVRLRRGYNWVSVRALGADGRAGLRRILVTRS